MKSENLTIEKILNTPKENIHNLQDYTCKIILDRVKEKGFVPVLYPDFQKLIMDVSCIKCGKIFKVNSSIAQLKHYFTCRKEVTK